MGYSFRCQCRHPYLPAIRRVCARWFCLPFWQCCARWEKVKARWITDAVWAEKWKSRGGSACVSLLAPSVISIANPCKRTYNLLAFNHLKGYGRSRFSEWFFAPNLFENRSAATCLAPMQKPSLNCCMTMVWVFFSIK